MTAGYRGHCIMTFTGWVLLNGFSSEWLQLYTSVCMAWLQHTWLAEPCLPSTASASRGGLWSATTSNLVIPRCRLSTYNTRAFSVAGPVCWNSLLDYLKSSDPSFNAVSPSPPVGPLAARSASPPVTLSLMHAQSEFQSADFAE